jgi:hypothetical protein
MKVMSINYDLGVRGAQNYQGLINVIKTFPGWCRVTKSTWYVRTSLSPQKVHDKLSDYLSPGDLLQIAPVAIGGGWWSTGLSGEVRKWLHRNLNSKAASRG